MRNMMAAENGSGLGIWVKLYPRVIFFGSIDASTAYPEKRGFSLSAPKKRVSVVGVFLWGKWVKSFLFTPKTIFNGPNKVIILHVSE